MSSRADITARRGPYRPETQKTLRTLARVSLTLKKNKSRHPVQHVQDMWRYLTGVPATHKEKGRHTAKRQQGRTPHAGSSRPKRNAGDAKKEAHARQGREIPKKKKNQAQTDDSREPPRCEDNGRLASEETNDKAEGDMWRKDIIAGTVRNKYS